MTLLAGFLDVVLRGCGAVGLSAAVGGLVWVLAVLRPATAGTPLGRPALERAVALIGWGALVVAGSEALLIFIIHPWALADAQGAWPVADFLATEFGLAALGRVVLAAALWAAARRLARAPEDPVRWVAAAALGGLLMLNAGWLAHAVSRLEGRGTLMVGTVLHQLGAVVWTGGVIHLVAFDVLWRRASRAEALGLRVLRRFSGVAFLAMALVLGPGVFLTWHYVGSWNGLVGTGYGIMVLTKVALLASALLLGALNFFLVRRAADGPTAVASRVPAFVEAEVGLGITLLLAAASLTSLPPAVDVVADRATPAEVAARFVPKMPRLTSPPVGQLLAAAAPIDDTLGQRQPEEYAWSEYNHHTAGLFVLLMGLGALLERTGRVRWARHWPLCFLGLAAFLFVRNDPRAWPLGPAGFWESMVLPDVLQHRMAVLLVVALGIFEWLVRTGRIRRPGYRLVFPMLAAVGGAILLSHSHAMFNLKSEFLTEISHAPMGILAVFVGWGRWLELRLDGDTGRIPGWLWAVSMTLIGLLLLFYREI
ncbi:MAG TPA: CopD family protein [Methylomirabilota bacterium]|nr:CopD family protein [Methylomirabilota bacterium]